MIKKVLIANRGEIALRVIRSCKEMGLKTVSVYSKADIESLHVRFADEAVCIGPAISKESYLSIPRIMAAAEITNSDAIHPGYGFLSENAEFSKICNESGIKFIGPDWKMIQKMGDKVTAKETMKKAGIPTVPGSDGLIESISDGKKLANKIGYPVILKATAGGGGKGMRIVNNEKDFESAWNSAKAESEASFSNSGLYLEKFIVKPRHIEIQVMGDQYGNVSHLSERDCSIQRRHQKLIEETPSPFVDDELRNRMGEAAVKACKFIKYEGAGTIEFLVDANKDFYFMEMNTRLQVEHPVSEEIYNFDLVKEQINVAAKYKLSSDQKKLKRNGHSIECRINAEDPDTFTPSPGLIKNYHAPSGPGVRVDSNCYSGLEISPYYDSLIAKLIVYDIDRNSCIQRLKRALNEFVIDGIKTTIPFFQEIITQKDFLNGSYDINWLEKYKETN